MVKEFFDLLLHFQSTVSSTTLQTTPSVNSTLISFKEAQGSENNRPLNSASVHAQAMIFAKAFLSSMVFFSK